MKYIKFLISLVRAILNSHNKPDSCYILAHKTKVLILTTGPSVLDDIKSVNLADYDELLAVNHFADISIFETIRPSIYVLQDPYFWNDDSQEEWISKRDKTIKNIIKKTKWPMDIFLPHVAKKTPITTKFEDNKNLNIMFYNASYLYALNERISPNRATFSKFEIWCLRRNLVGIAPVNVLPTAIYLAIKFGLSKIDVAGTDLSFFRNFELTDQQKTLKLHIPYYVNSKCKVVYNDKKGHYPGTLSFQLNRMALIFEMNEKISHFAEECGVTLRILNKNCFFQRF